MDLRSVFLGLSFALMWSSAFASARIIVLEAPPLMALSLRFFISGTVAVGIALLLKQSWRLTKAQWRAIVVFGLCQNALYLGLNFIAMQTVQASIAAIIASTMPLLVALVGWVFLRQRLPIVALLGLVTGLVGVLVIMVPRLQGGLDPWGVLLCVLGVASLTIATLSVRNAVSSGQVLMIVGLQMLVGSAALTVPALLFETWNVTITPLLAGAFSYTTLVPGLAATVIWFVLVSRIGAVRAATFHFLNPFFGVALAAVLLGEQIGLIDVLGVAIIAAGIFAVQVSKQTK
ncbi:MAG: DMT family transporter [Nereida ignava]|uniref:DMT family transporter n=1 Tax=Nereida ignava TaxID=282199 RepID=UPI0030FA545A